MGYGVTRAYSFTMGAAKTTATVNVGQSYERTYLQIPTFTSITALDLYVSPDGTQTYYQVGQGVPTTATIQCLKFQIAATATSGGMTVPIPAGFQYYKVVAVDSAPAAAMGFQVICSS